MKLTGQVLLPTDIDARDTRSRLTGGGAGPRGGSGVARETCPEPDPKSRRSAAERAARAEIESRLALPLNDSEWTKQRNRLVEFIQMLARWDSEQRERDVLSEPERKLAS